MKVKCENLVVCGNYNCERNSEGYCIHRAIALDASGKCVLEKPKRMIKVNPNKDPLEGSNAC